MKLPPALQNRIRFVATVLLSITIVACATGGGVRRSSSNVITREEVLASTAADAYELVQELRPQFLRPRGVVSINDSNASYPVVYLNGVRYGEIEWLRTIDVRTIVEIRFMNAQDATTRWGTGHAGGAIAVQAEYR